MLVRFLVADGDLIEQERHCAEIEVMKMSLTFHAPESGRIYLAKPAGSAIDVGDVVATSDSDDPTKGQTVGKGIRQTSANSSATAIGTKPHQRFDVALKNVEHLVRDCDASELF
jgi:pyruvate/2-oxoglutarate dehydrogenase complex dihydrolipoamide acyltransferase (E2) component